jgi:hypothetical protein
MAALRKLRRETGDPSVDAVLMKSVDSFESSFTKSLSCKMLDRGAGRAASRILDRPAWVVNYGPRRDFVGELV